MVKTSEKNVPGVRPGAQPSLLPGESCRFWPVVAQCSHSGERERQLAWASRAMTANESPTCAVNGSGGSVLARPLLSSPMTNPLSMTCRSSSTTIGVLTEGPPERIQELQTTGWVLAQGPSVAPGYLVL